MLSEDAAKAVEAFTASRSEEELIQLLEIFGPQRSRAQRAFRRFAEDVDDGQPATFVLSHDPKARSAGERFTAWNVGGEPAQLTLPLYGLKSAG